MANPQGYPAQGYSQEEYDQSQSGTPVPAPSQVPAKKKRAYAGQAFEFGTGANAGQPATQTPPPAAAYGAAQPAAGYGYGAPVQQPAGYPDPQQQQPAAGYGAPAAGYQPPDAYGTAPGGVPGMTQQFSQMGMAPQQQQQQQPAQAPQQAAPAAQRLNPLQPVDISVQGAPFHVSDLDLPPPPIILPPNVRLKPRRQTGSLDSSALDPSLTCAIVQRNPLSQRKLPAQVRSLDIERHSFNKLAPQEVQASLRPCYPTLRYSPRRRGRRACPARSGHCKMSQMPYLHQSLCHFPRPQPPMALQHVQPDQRCSPSLRLGQHEATSH